MMIALTACVDNNVMWQFCAVGNTPLDKCSVFVHAHKMVLFFTKIPVFDKAKRMGQYIALTCFDLCQQLRAGYRKGLVTQWLPRNLLTSCLP